MIWDKLSDITFSVVDLETTGLSYEKDEILEISIVHVNNGVIKNVWDSLVKPKKRVRLELTEIHGIDNDMLMTAPSKPFIVPKVSALLEDTYFVEHNQNNFDSTFLENFLCHKNWFGTINTLRFAKLIIPGLKSYSLETLCNNERIELPKHHIAKDDAIATANLFIKLVEKSVSERLPIEDIRTSLGIPKREQDDTKR